MPNFALSFGNEAPKIEKMTNNLNPYQEKFQLTDIFNTANNEESVKFTLKPIDILEKLFIGSFSTNEV